jgi:hypothetical protein
LQERHVPERRHHCSKPHTWKDLDESAPLFS